MANTLGGVDGVRVRVLAWAGLAFAALLAFELAAWVGVVVLALGAGAVVLLLPEQWPLRVFTASALLPVALGSGEPPVWVLPLAAAAVALVPRRAPVSFIGHDELQRHLDRARRRDESLHVMVARGESLEAPRAEDLAGSFRTADSVSLHVRGRRYELVAVFDDHKLERAGVERRLAERLPGVDLTIGWALFPGDGYSVSSLADHARRDLRPPAPVSMGVAGDHPSDASVLGEPAS